MCGIAGVVGVSPAGVVDSVIDMLSLIQHRGRDATGIAAFQRHGEVILRSSLKDESLNPKLSKIVRQYAEIIEEKLLDGKNSIPVAEHRLKMNESDIVELHTAINKTMGLCVHSIGSDLVVYKENGVMENLLSKHKIDRTHCRHAIGHVRMATESAEDVNAAHPFVSPFYPGLAIVHNGQFTNYFNVRRFLEAKGAIFKTLNDSEAASHLIAYAMRENGGNLEQALKYAGDELDGIFCIIAATGTQIGFVKDRIGIKPLLLAQTKEYILMGSEQIEFSAVEDGVFAAEMGPGEVRTWNI
jgi:glutamine phosphoribosylpyrophosphate amidotransferase